jgi:uncharacterized protein (UPF0212 family)
MELRYVQLEKESIMKCPNCGKEMRDGYLFILQQRWCVQFRK